MKNYTIEEKIIKSFIKKSKRDRVIWELKNPQKREMIFWKFGHPDLFDENCLCAIGYMDSSKLYEYLFKLGGNKNIYYLGESYIGALLLEKAVELVETGEICIIYCGNGIAYYQGESDMGNRQRYLLKKSV